MGLPRPPSRLPEPNRRVLASGTVLHRLHHKAFAGDAFNPCRGRPTRFAPLRKQDGSCVPSLYAGSTVEAAIFETVFHDIPAAAAMKTVPLGTVLDMCHSQVSLNRALTLAELREPDLKRWGIGRAQLIGGNADTYPETVLWAEAVHRSFEEIEGLLWTSAQCDPDDCVILFGDRVGRADLTLSGSRNAETDETLIADIRDAGIRAGIVLTL